MAVRRGLARLDHHLAEQDDQEQAEALREVVRVERLRGVLGPQRRQVVVAAHPAGRRAVLGKHRARLDADRDRPQRVTQRLGRGRGEGEQGGGAQAGPRDAVVQQAPALAGDGVRAGEDQARDGEAQREHRAVARGRGLDRHGRDADRDAGGQEEQPLDGLVGAEAVVEHGEAHPGPPQREEQPERDPDAAHRRLGHDQVRELGDGEHDDEVEVQLDPGHALALVVHQPRGPRPRSRPASADVPS